MFKGVSSIFIVPWFLLLALAVALGVWRGRKHGAARGLKTAAAAIGLGLVALVVFFVAVIVVYYAMGGH